MGDVRHTLRTAFKIINALLKGPYTVKEIAEITSISDRVAYNYIKTINEVLPVLSVKRKRNIKGRGLQPTHYWLE